MASLLALALYMKIPFNEKERLGIHVPLYESIYTLRDDKIEPKWSVYRSHCFFLDRLCKTELKLVERRNMKDGNVLEFPHILCNKIYVNKVQLMSSDDWRENTNPILTKYKDVYGKYYVNQSLLLHDIGDDKNNKVKKLETYSWCSIAILSVRGIQELDLICKGQNIPKTFGKSSILWTGIMLGSTLLHRHMVYKSDEFVTLNGYKDEYVSFLEKTDGLFMPNSFLLSIPSNESRIKRMNNIKDII